MTNTLTMPPADTSAAVDYERCYTLTLSHGGEGLDPLTAPANTTSCPAGAYMSGAAITLTAVPYGRLGRGRLEWHPR